MSDPFPLVAWVDGIGLRGPGLAGWPASAAILAGRAAYRPEPTVLVAPSSLPPAERRRVGKGVKIALEAGFDAVAASGRDAAMLPSIFASSSGDGDNCDAICRELTGERLISPTRFHNSVHNAPSGYWGIASGSRQASTSLCAYDDSVAAGLDDALTQLATGASAVLLVAYDAPYPEPLFATRPTPDAFAIGLVLARAATPCSLARITVVATRAGGGATTMDDPALEAMRTAIPAARALPLAAAVARGAPASVDLVDARGGRFRVRLDPPTRVAASGAERLVGRAVDDSAPRPAHVSA